MKKFFSARKGLLVFAGLLLSISTVSAAPKANNLKFKLGQMAENIAKFLKDDLNQSKVRMGRFSALTSVQSSAGTGMAKTLADSLKKHGITVSKISAPVIVQGEFEDVTDSVSGHLALHVKVKLLDTKTKRKLSTQDFQVGIFGEENLAKHLGPTVDLPPKGTPKDRNKKLQHSLDKPNATVTGKSIVSAKKDSHYAIELLVKRNGK